MSFSFQTRGRTIALAPLAALLFATLAAQVPPGHGPGDGNPVPPPVPKRPAPESADAYRPVLDPETVDERRASRSTTARAT